MALEPITAGLEFIGKIADKIWPDPVQRAEGQLRLAELQQTGELAQLTADTDLAKGQLAINQAEAQSQSLFVAGWRPFCGWVCGVALAYHFVLQPLLAFALANAGQEVKLPDFDMDTLMTVLLGMLGLGGLRSLDKIKGVSR